MEMMQKILTEGAKLAGRFGAVNVTHKMVGEKVGITGQGVGTYFDSAADARKSYVKELKRTGGKEPDADKIAKHAIALRKAAGAKQSATKATKKKVAKKSR